MNKKLLLKLLALTLIAFVALQAAAPAPAKIIQTGTFFWTDPASGGELQIKVQVSKDYWGNYKWTYIVKNISYEPSPGFSNGFSGFNIHFPVAVPEFHSQTGPSGWEMNCCGVIPPFGAEWDIRNSDGYGIPIGGKAVFSFRTAPRELVVYSSHAHTWISDIQVNIFYGDLFVPGELLP